MEMIIRINVGEKGAFDWRSPPEKVTFRDTMNLICKDIFPNGPAVTAFMYEDEEGDMITVRTEDEMAKLVAFHAAAMDDGGSEHLVIYPKVGKTAGKRNIEGLKVHTSPPGPESSDAIPMDSGRGSVKQQPKDLGEILSGGTPINDSDLHIMELLGEGSVGTVYKAQHKSTGTVMAVKMMQLEMTADLTEVQKQIMSELQVLYKCRSPVIIAFYGAYFVESRISICTEYMDGGSLDKYKGIGIQEEVLGRMTVSVVSGLHYLWKLKIMHRDVKPSNLLVNTRGQVKLCDFGVSVQLAASMAKTVIGTRAYMAPERIRGEDYSVDSDVWSLGVTLFELAIGRFPYDSALPHSLQEDAEDNKTILLPLEAAQLEAGITEGNKPMQLIKSIVFDEPPRLPPGIFSEVFEDFIHGCVRKDPKTRPLPENLMHHPLIGKYDDGNLEIVAQWVCTKLEEMKAHAQSAQPLET